MKLIILLLLLIPNLAISQAAIEFRCDRKLSEWAMWEVVDATIRITERHIAVSEQPGIVLAIEYDKKEKLNGLMHYSYEGSVRTTHIDGFEPEIPFLITVMTKHYMCKVK